MKLVDWSVNIRIGDAPPEWALADTCSRTLGRALISIAAKEVEVWLRKTKHVDGGHDPVATLFHEGLHVCHQDVGLEFPAENVTDAQEGHIDRVAEVMSFAYRKGMKAEQGKDE